MIILGISCYYHDAAACILRDGKIIAAAAEERFTRKKHDNNFPTHAIEYCLTWARLTIGEVDAVAFYEKPIIKFSRTIHQHLEYFPKSRKSFVNSMGTWLDKKLAMEKVLKKECGYKGKIFFIEHHLSHAASSFYLSGFRQASIVTLDGVGEWATSTVGMGTGKTIRIDKEIHFPHSLGLLYSAITGYLGFSVNDSEYKVMGLAAYGDPKPFREHFRKLLTVFPDGSIELAMEYFDYGWSDRMISKNMENLFGYPTRKAEGRVHPYHKNIAASLQESLENAVISMLTAVHKEYKIDDLCLAGGVALNSVMNGKILKLTPFKRLYIPPDPGDAGGAIGAALTVWCQRFGKQAEAEFYPALGPGFAKEAIADVLDEYTLPYTEYEQRDRFLDTVSSLLAKKKIVGWFQGRMEWGPRALGNRSILASAATEEMKDIINSKVKHREMFRPFAPVVLKKYVHAYFKTDSWLSPSSRYMLMVYPCTEKAKREVPATVHVDGTGRLQVLERNDNPLYYDLIEAYRKKTGTPIIINTSFNVRGEPIVCTPEDAVKCFLGTDIDYLVIGPYIVKKETRV